jgi:deoxyribose-phosphate aldolase
MCKYTPEKIASVIDLAALRPEHTREATKLACIQAAYHNCASVCVKPCFVDIAAKELENTGVGIGTVINFPHGNSTPEVAAFEAYNSIGAGANELDMVINIGAALGAQWALVLDGIEAVTAIGHEYGAIVKVILETCYLPPIAIRKVCRLCVDVGVDFVKTSTGFGVQGATRDAVIQMRDAVDGKCQVKASGGIKTYKDAELYLDLGCTRLGSSRVEALFPY